jgi:hypothetical protein
LVTMDGRSDRLSVVMMLIETRNPGASPWAIPTGKLLLQGDVGKGVDEYYFGER